MPTPSQILSVLCNPRAPKDEAIAMASWCSHYCIENGSEGAALRGSSQEGNIDLVLGILTHLKRTLDTDFIFAWQWMFNPKQGLSDPNLRHMMANLPAFLAEYKNAYKKQLFELTGNMINSMSNILVHTGRKGVTGDAYLKAGVVELLKPIVESGDLEKNSVSAALLTANLLGQDESQAAVMAHAIPQVLKVVSASLTNTIYGGRGWNPGGACKALLNISIADNNKQAMIDNGAVGLLHSVITFDWESESDFETYGAAYFNTARAAAASTLWGLSFQHAIEDMESDLLPTMTRIDNEDSDVQDLALAAKGFLFNVNERKAKAAQTSGGTVRGLKRNKTMATSQQGHVMVSYCWDQQELVLKVKESLEASGYHVWLDLDNMSASTLEAMAKAVEDSIVVLVCFSSAYKESTACRTEAEYAYTRRKAIVPLKVESGYHADGWLGALLGTKLYFEFKEASGKKFTKAMEGLIKELGHRGRVGAAPATPMSSHSGDQAALDAAERRIASLEKQLASRAPAPDTNASPDVQARLDAIETRLGSLESKLDQILRAVTSS